MRTRLIAVLIGLCLSTTVMAATRPVTYGHNDLGDTSTVLRAKAFILERMDTLSTDVGLVWPDGWVPSVCIGIPDIVPPDKRFGTLGVYLPDSSAIYFQEFVFNPPDGTNDSLGYKRLFWALTGKPAKVIVDHELGHAYVSEHCRRTLGHVWPPEGLRLHPDSLLGLAILNEGLAKIVENHARGDTTSMPDKLWNTKVDLRWVMSSPGMWNAIVNDGGYRLLSPLAYRYGLDAVILYVTDHPLIVQKGKLRKTAGAWRKQAEQDLARTVLIEATTVQPR